MSDTEQPTDAERIAALEAEVRELQTQVAALKRGMEVVYPRVVSYDPKVIDSIIDLATARAAAGYTEGMQAAFEHAEAMIKRLATEAIERLRPKTAAELLAEYDQERAEKPGLTLKGFAAQRKLNYSSLRTANTRRKKRP